jgi:hypothetical protein
VTSVYLASYIDPGLAIDTTLTKEDIVKEEVDRLSRLYTIANVAADIPRRIGGEATREELAKDKSRCRRVAHVAFQCARSWSNRKTVTLADDVGQEAAQVVWARWYEEHRVFLHTRLNYIASWAYATGVSDKWTKKAIVRLNNEVRWLEYAMRD